MQDNNSSRESECPGRFECRRLHCRNCRECCGVNGYGAFGYCAECMREPAWTPGPWRVESWRREKGTNIAAVPIFQDVPDRPAVIGYAAHSDECAAGDTAADAALIALAPEMAEVIMRASRGGHKDCGLAYCAACSLANMAQRLREIGNE